MKSVFGEDVVLQGHILSIRGKSSFHTLAKRAEFRATTKPEMGFKPKG
jgi:hypothetical protein